jgi:hypothetical protein
MVHGKSPGSLITNLYLRWPYSPTARFGPEMIEAHRDDPLDGDAIGLAHVNSNTLVAMITAAIVTCACAWVRVRSEQETIDQSDYIRIHISSVTCKREGEAVVGSDNVVAATTGESFATSVLRDFVSAERVLRRVLLYIVCAVRKIVPS